MEHRAHFQTFKTLNLVQKSIFCCLFVSFFVIKGVLKHRNKSNNHFKIQVHMVGIALPQVFPRFTCRTQSPRMQQGEYRLLRYGFTSYAPSEEMEGLPPERAHCGASVCVSVWRGCVCVCVRSPPPPSLN